MFKLSKTPVTTAFALIAVSLAGAPLSGSKIAVFVTLALLLSGCGNKGDLELPDSRDAEINLQTIEVLTLTAEPTPEQLREISDREIYEEDDKSKDSDNDKDAGGAVN